MSKDVRQPLNHRYARIQKRRSESVRPGRGWRRCRTSSCWRRQRLSASATALAASRQQRPTANRETLTSPACCRTSREADAAQCRQGKGFPDYNFAPYRGVLTKQSVRVWLQKHEIGEFERVPRAGMLTRTPPPRRSTPARSVPTEILDPRLQVHSFLSAEEALRATLPGNERSHASLAPRNLDHLT